MESIYPKLPTAPAPNNLEANNYRIQKILDIQNSFEKTKDDRRKTLKKYSRILNLINGTDGVLTTLSIAVGASGLVLLSTVVATPIVIVMEGVSIGTGLLSIIAKYLNKKLQHKADKHQKILTLSESKLNTIQDHISKALEDGTISEEEFKLILEEETKFREMKEEIRKHTKIHQPNEYANLLKHEKEEILKKMKTFLDESKI